MDLTKRQQEIFDFIKRYSAKYGYPPTVRDIGKAVGLASSSTVHAHLANLEKLGLLRRDPPSRARSSCSTASATSARQVASRTSASRCAAGCRSSARSRPARRCSPRRTSRTTSQVPAIAGGEEGEYVLRVRGESMKDAGILEGDYVVVRPQETADDGEIVVALVGARRRPSSASSARPTTSACSPRTTTMEPIRSRTSASSGGVVGLFRSVA